MIDLMVGYLSRNKDKDFKPLNTLNSGRPSPLGRPLFTAFFSLVMATNVNAKTLVEMPPIGLCLKTELMASKLKSVSKLNLFAFGIAGLNKTAALGIYTNKRGHWVLIQSKKENGRSCVIGAGTNFHSVEKSRGIPT